MSEDLKEQFALAKKLIMAKQYPEARRLLRQIKHPKAVEWLTKLDELDPPTAPPPQSARKSPTSTSTAQPPIASRSNNRLVMVLGIGGLLLIAVLVATYFLFIGGEPDTPTAQAEEVIDALNDHDLERAAKYMCNQDREELLDSIDEMSRYEYTFEDVSCIQDGNLVRCSLRFNQKDGEGFFHNQIDEATFSILDENTLCSIAEENEGDEEAAAIATEIAVTQEAVSVEVAAAETAIALTSTVAEAERQTAIAAATSASTATSTETLTPTPSPTPTATFTPTPTPIAIAQLPAINKANASQIQRLGTRGEFEQPVVAYFDPGGEFAVVLDEQGGFSSGLASQIHVYDIPTMSEIQTVSPAEEAIFEVVSLSPSGNLLAAGSSINGKIWVWDTQTWTEKFTFTGFENPTEDLFFTQDDQLLVSADSSHGIIVWDMNTGTQKAILHEPGGFGSGDLTISPTGNIAAYFGSDQVLLWNPQTASIIDPPEGANPPAAISANGQLLALTDQVDRQYKILLYQADTLAPVGELPLGGDRVMQMGFSPDSHYFYVIDRSNTLRVFDVTANTLVAESQVQGDIYYATFSPDNTLIGLISDNQALLLDALTLTQIMPLPNLDLNWISFSADGKLIMVSGSELQLWGLAQ